MTELGNIIIGAIVGGIISFLLAERKFQQELLGRLDESTSKDRMEAYKILWGLTGLLPRFPPSETVTYADLKRLSNKFRAWYFGEGGIYLTETSKKAYFDVQELLLKLANDHEAQQTQMTILDSAQETGDYWTVYNYLRTLRNHLTEDVRSRQRPGRATPDA
ncbi:MAG: hypothetical protein GC204_19585 [Chloroflexi bacterium]|nr:hypothetical protein [Chloroflexota bacterium]